MRGRWLIEQLQRSIVVRCSRYTMPWPSLVVGIQRAESLRGLYLWCQTGTRVCSMLVGLLPVPEEKPTSARGDAAMSPGDKSRQQFEEALPERMHDKRNFWFEGPRGHA
jgi:hypothetical protein